MLARALLRWFARNARDLPWRRTLDPYAIWVSEIMLQQTQVKTVIPYWERWMRELPTLQALACARPAKVLKLWEGLGYYTRARNLQAAARFVVGERDGRFPTTFEDVLALPGIGRYTAGAVCSIAFNQPTPVLDGNVIRVLARVFAVRGDPKEKRVRERMWGLADELVRHAAVAPTRGRRNCSDLNQALMELGAMVCVPRNPRCPDCPLRSRCATAHASHRAPGVSKRPLPTARRMAAFVVGNNGRFWVRQRPADAVNGGLWEFPNAVLEAGSSPELVAREILGWQGTMLERLLEIRHSITRYRITLEVYRLDGRGAASDGEGRWATPGQLGALAFPSAHRKILEHLASGRPARFGRKTGKT